MTADELREFFRGVVSINPDIHEGQLSTLELTSTRSRKRLVILCDHVDEMNCPNCDFTWGWHRSDCKVNTLFQSANAEKSQPTNESSEERQQHE